MQFSSSNNIEQEIKTKLVQQSLEALRNLINIADSQRKSNKYNKSIDFHDAFFKEAKKHII